MAVTFIAGVHPLCQQHTAQLALSALLLRHLDQVRRHTERVVVDLIFTVLPETEEEGAIRGWSYDRRDHPLLLVPSPTADCHLSNPFVCYKDALPSYPSILVDGWAALGLLSVPSPPGEAGPTTWLLRFPMMSQGKSVISPEH